MEHKEIVINNQKVKPGEHRLIKLNVASLPSGTVINLQFHVYRSENPGPTLLVLGGVHGDEINGVEIVRRALALDFFENMKAGSVIAIPLLNIYGFINFSRDAPDGKDVNRSFPGSSTGSLASRVAKTLTSKILPLVDYGVDFHTGGDARYNYPQIRFSPSDKKATELARVFAPPYIIKSAPIAKSLRKVAMNMGIPIIVYEGGESLRFDGYAIQKGVSGLQRVMHHLGMAESPPLSAGKSIVFRKTTWIRASKAGLFRWSRQSGAKVSIGEPLGVINDPYGQHEIDVIARKEGYIIGHNNVPVVSRGDALFHIGMEEEVW